MRAKQKIVQGRGPSNMDLGIFVCCFDVCQASKLVPSINYGEQLKVDYTQILASLFAALMFAGLHNQSPLLTM